METIKDEVETKKEDEDEISDHHVVDGTLKGTDQKLADITKPQVNDEKLADDISTNKPKMKRDEMNSVCSSSKLDEFLSSGQKDLRVSYSVPKSGSVEFVSDQTTEMPLTEIEPKYFGIMAGLGIKRKTEKGMRDFKAPCAKKPKTLYEKRKFLDEEIAKYGLDAVEKMYPRSQNIQEQKRGSLGMVKGSPIKMKPKPYGLDFEEIDARRILRPLSHDKYIHEPLYDSVVYISRRSGLVPLSSLCKDSNTILSSNVQHVKGRNVRLGKPCIFIEDKAGRLIAVGGSRGKAVNLSLNIIRPPKLVKEKKSSAVVPFEIDNEYANFAASAFVNLGPKNTKVDVRTIKRQQRAMENEDKVEPQLSSKENIVKRLFQKLQKAEETDEDLQLKSRLKEEDKKPDLDDEEMAEEINLKEEKVDETEIRKEEESKENVEEENVSDNEFQDIMEHDESDQEEVEEEEELENEEKENQKPNHHVNNVIKDSKCQVHNEWIKELNPFPNADIEKGPIVTDEFARKLLERRKNPLAGVDACDVDDCFCKEEESATSTMPTEIQTPLSGSQTPLQSQEGSGNTQQKKVKNKLNKVKRALKSLGVNFYEFDDNVGQAHRECFKDICRLGCICDAIASKPCPPTHCGKVECMLKCFCSEDAVKFGSSKKVGVSPAGAANLRSSSQRRMAAEERKFHNTVVATSGGQDLVMLGSSGRQKRGRKVPSRYQDSEAIMMDSSGKDLFGGKGDLNDIDDYTLGNPMLELLKKESLMESAIKKCAVLVPLIELPKETEKWCMFHCEHSCPCFAYKNPLDYGPDRNDIVVKPKPSKTLPVKTTTNEEEKILKKDIAPHERPAPKRRKTKSEQLLQNHCARSAGYKIRPSNRVRLPYRIVTQKAIPPRNGSGEVVSSRNSSTENDAKKDKLDAKDPPEFDVTMKKRGAVQYVPWHVFRSNFIHDKITVYCHIRANKVLAFLSKSNGTPYVTQAENIKKIDQAKYQPLPAAIESLLNQPHDENETVSSKYVILTHNGLAWEISGVLQKKKSNSDGAPIVSRDSYSNNQQQQQQEMTPTHSRNQQPSSVINSQTQVLKLPMGQSVVTMQRAANQNMQIKLPATNSNQHWCTIRVDNAQGTVQCPDSKMTLKCNVLKQAASLAMKEDTTVRIPITVVGEVATFGVYAVPGLSSHVFIGPFTNGVGPKVNEVICLDSPPPPPQPVNQQDDDEIEVLSETTTNTSTMSTKIQPFGNFKGIIGDTMITQEEKRPIADKTLKKVIISGAVPQVIQPEKKKSDDNKNINQEVDDDIVIIEEKEPNKETGGQKSQSEALKESASLVKLPYLNQPVSVFGKVVIASERPNEDATKPIEIQFGDLKVQARQRINGFLSFKHPKLKGHNVLCSSVSNAEKWLEEFVNNDEKKPAEESFTLQMKPLSALMSTKATTESKVGDITKRTHEVLNPDGSRGKAIFLDRKQQKEMATLFYDLGNEAFQNFFCRNYSHLQILTKAREECLKVRQEEKELEQSKLTLMMRRKKLFEEFTKALEGLPIEVKKQKLLELKNMIKKKENVISEPTRNSYQMKGPPSTPHQQMQQQQHQMQQWQQEEQQRGLRPQVPPPLAVFNKNAAIGINQANKPIPSGTEKIMISPPLPINNDPHGAFGAAPYSDVTGLRTVKKDGKVLRPMNAFMLWAKDHRRTLISNGYDGATVSKMLADEWKELTDVQKQKYYLEAEHLKNLHLLQHPDYKYSPRARNKNVKRIPNKPGLVAIPMLAMGKPKRIAPAPAAMPNLLPNPQMQQQFRQIHAPAGATVFNVINSTATPGGAQLRIPQQPMNAFSSATTFSSAGGVIFQNQAPISSIIGQQKPQIIQQQQQPIVSVHQKPLFNQVQGPSSVGGQTQVILNQYLTSQFQRQFQQHVQQQDHSNQQQQLQIQQPQQQEKKVIETISLE